MNDATTVRSAADDPHDGGRISEAVVEAVADAKGVSSVDLRTPLYAVVDPDALDELVASMPCWSGEPTGFVTFPYSGYEVTVTADGEVAVAKAESSTPDDVPER